MSETERPEMCLCGGYQAPTPASSKENETMCGVLEPLCLACAETHAARHAGAWAEAVATCESLSEMEQQVHMRRCLEVFHETLAVWHAEAREERRARLALRPPAAVSSHPRPRKNRPTRKAQREAEAQRRHEREAEAERRKALLNATGVYVVQLLERANTVKIGASTWCENRLSGLRQQYGALRSLLIIPHEHPRTLEKALHHRFIAMRIYDGASASELFCFVTTRQQRLFEQFLQEFSTCRLAPVYWGMPRAAAGAPARETPETLPLFQ